MIDGVIERDVELARHQREALNETTALTPELLRKIDAYWELLSKVVFE